MTPFLPTLKTATPEEGYELAVKMARVAINMTQSTDIFYQLFNVNFDTLISEKACVEEVQGPTLGIGPSVSDQLGTTSLKTCLAGDPITVVEDQYLQLVVVEEQHRT